VAKEEIFKPLDMCPARQMRKLRSYSSAWRKNSGANPPTSLRTDLRMSSPAEGDGGNAGASASPVGSSTRATSAAVPGADSGKRWHGNRFAER